MINLNCILCGSTSLDRILLGRHDHEYEVTTQLNYYRCAASDCRHVQVLPMPSSEKIATFYENYTTHSVYKPRGLAKVLNLLSERTAIHQLHLLKMDFKERKDIKILDFGCGNGVNLKRMEKLGYQNLYGFDFDPQAVSLVLSQGIACSSRWDDFSQATFDVIFLNHVIEHLPNPAATLNKILYLLRPGGEIIIRTPNSRSFLAILCGVNWRGWETPRHLNIFTCTSLEQMFALNRQFLKSKSYTSNDMLVAMAISSLPKKMNKIKALKFFIALFLIFSGIVAKLFHANSGEEIVFVAKKIHE